MAGDRDRLRELLREAADHAGGADTGPWLREAQALADRAPDPAGLLDRLAVRRLREAVLPQADRWPESVRGRVIAVIERAVETIEQGGDRAAVAVQVHKAAWAMLEESWAWLACIAAKRALLMSGALAAKSALKAAHGWWEAATAAWDQERQRIMEELRAHVTTEGAR